jgi:hypothetical protein
MELITKELAYADHPISDKMQVTIILNGLPLSWEHVITSLIPQRKKHFHNFLTSFTCVRRRDDEKKKKRRTIQQPYDSSKLCSYFTCSSI